MREVIYCRINRKIMIEQTALVVDEWIYREPASALVPGDQTMADLTLEVMRKSAPGKKGLACRFTYRMENEAGIILLYVARDSYVIDLGDKVDKAEILKMIRNTYSKFREKYDLRKIGTILQNEPLKAFDETSLDIDPIYQLLLEPI